MLVVLDGDRRAAALEHDQLGARRCAAARRWSATSPGGAERDLRAVQADHAVPAARLLDVVGGDEQDRGPRRAARRTPPRSAPRWRRRRRDSGSSSSSTRLSCSSARAIRTRWRWPPDSAPKRLRARSARPTRSSAARAASRSARGERPPRRRAAVGAHQHDVERADREVEPRAVGLRHVGRPALELDRPAPHRQLAQHRAEERRLAAAVGAEHGRDRARLEREVDAGQHLGARRVAAAQAPRRLTAAPPRARRRRRRAPRWPGRGRR